MASSQPATLQGGRLESPGSRRRYVVGGACVTKETFPGFKVSTAAYVNSLFRKEIIQDLGLESYGLKILERNPLSFRNNQQP